MIRRTGVIVMAVLLVSALVLLGLQRRDPDIEIKEIHPATERFEVDQQKISFSLRNTQLQWVDSREILRPKTFLILTTTWCGHCRPLLEEAQRLQPLINHELESIIVIDLYEDNEDPALSGPAAKPDGNRLFMASQLLNRYPDLIKGIPTILELNGEGLIRNKYEGVISLEKVVD